MYDLTVIKKNGGCYIDSREVAELIGKQHKHLLRDIRGYCDIMEISTKPKIGLSDFFIESSYLDPTGRTLPCFLLSKMGCEMVANKLTGEKGVLFTAAYVAKFNEMETAERAALHGMRVPRLGEYNAAARLIVRALRAMNAKPEHILDFLKGLYEPLGIIVNTDVEMDVEPQWYTAKQIAELLGIYSLTGNPHPQAISCILNENLFIEECHKSVITQDYGNHIGVSVRYDDHAVQAVMEWLTENGFPNEVYGFERTYNIRYSN